MTFGLFLHQVVIELTKAHGWVEHANALLYTPGAPGLVDCLVKMHKDGQSVQDAAAEIASRLVAGR